MSRLPQTAEDVLAVPSDQVPEVLRGLMQTRSLSDLVARLDDALWSGDSDSTGRARDALVHLGFLV